MLSVSCKTHLKETHLKDHGSGLTTLFHMNMTLIVPTKNAPSHPDCKVQQDTHGDSFLRCGGEGGGGVQNRPCAWGLRLSVHFLSLLGISSF